MDSWTLKKGYPVISIKRLDFENSSEATATVLVIKQNWFLLNPLAKSYKQKSVFDSYRWYVPFTFTRKSELNFEFESKPYWLMPNQTESKIFSNLYRKSHYFKSIFSILRSIHRKIGHNV